MPGCDDSVYNAAIRVLAGYRVMALRPTILEADQRRIGMDWREKNVYSTFWRLYRNGRSGAEALLDTGVYKIAPGRLHVIPAWVRFSCRCRRSIDHQYVHFVLDGLPGAISRCVFTEPFAFDGPDWLGGAFVGVEPGAVRELRVKSCVYAGLAAAFDRLTASQREVCRPFLTGSHRFGPLLRWIDEHLSEPLGNAELAARAHLSPGQFIRSFHRVIGQSPRQYIRERRIAASAQRLRFTDDSIDRIAADCGFSDRFYFSRVFKQVMNLPPAAYRRRQQV